MYLTMIKKDCVNTETKKVFYRVVSVHEFFLEEYTNCLVVYNKHIKRIFMCLNKYHPPGSFINPTKELKNMYK